jgi:hypothetical protein
VEVLDRHGPVEPEFGAQRGDARPSGLQTAPAKEFLRRVTRRQQRERERQYRHHEQREDRADRP